MSGTQGVPQLERRLEAIGKVANSVLRDWQIRTIALAKIAAPKRTGHLKQSIHPGPVTQFHASVEASAPYAGYMEFGTKPHLIRPRFKKVLAWGGARRLTGTLRKGSQATIFAKEVHHPGTEPRPYLQPAGMKAVAELNLGGKIKTLWNEAA